jgi:uncharacterized protein YecE (DUF72 family)
MAANIYIGTSGWSYPAGEGTWKGYFYPAGRINELVENWVRRTPQGFLFTVKLWQKFTHPRMYQEVTGEPAVISPSDVGSFLDSIRPLYQSGKLGALLAQFPPSFKNDSYGRRILKAVVHTFGSYRLVVELRHRSWSDDEDTAGLLRQNNICWAQIDEPKFKDSVAAEVPVTADIAYFRFHGRNAEMWWRGDNETRYKYLYSPEEIEELSGRVSKAAEKAKLAFVFFNNHWRAYAPRNAVDMMKALQLPFRDFILVKESPAEKEKQK